MNKDFTNRYNRGERYFLSIELDESDVLDNLNLDNTTFENCIIASSFVGASLANAKFISSNLNTSVFTNAVFKNTVFESCSLEATVLTGANEDDVQFIGCHSNGQELEWDLATQALIPIRHPNVKLLYEYIPEFERTTQYYDEWADYLLYGRLGGALFDDIVTNQETTPFTQKCFDFFNMMGDRNDSEIDNLLIVGVYEELYSNKKCNETAIALLQGRNREVYIYWMHNGFIIADI